RGGGLAARSVQDEIEALLAVELVNDGHEAIFVGIIDLLAPNSWLLESARVIDDNVSFGDLVQALQIIPADNIIRAAFNLDLVQQVVPARHGHPQCVEWSSCRVA